MINNMKNIFYFLILFLILGLSGLFIKISIDFEEYKIQIANEKWEQEKRIKEIEKNMRILKMDLYIKENGFEGETQ